MKDQDTGWLLHKQDLSEEELNLLDKYGINGDLTTNELETKISLVAAFQSLYNWLFSTLRNSSIQ